MALLSQRDFCALQGFANTLAVSGLLAPLQQQQKICLKQKYPLLYSKLLSRNLEGFNLDSQPGTHLILRITQSRCGASLTPCKSCSILSSAFPCSMVVFLPRVLLHSWPGWGGTRGHCFPTSVCQSHLQPEAKFGCFSGWHSAVSARE